MVNFFKIFTENFRNVDKEGWRQTDIRWQFRLPQSSMLPEGAIRCEIKKSATNITYTRAVDHVISLDGRITKCLKLNLFYTPLTSINDEQNKIAFTMRLLRLFGKFQMHVNGAHKYALLQSHNFNTLN